MKQYIKYLKNNPEGYWFKRKIYGWGWVPVRWQGWLMVGCYVGAVTFLMLTREVAIPGNPDSGSNFLVLGLPLIILTILFILIVYKKGEKPKWMWGLPPKDKN